MSDLQIAVYEQLPACAAVGALLGALAPHPYTGSRTARAAEGTAVGILFAVAFMLGAGRLDEGRSDPLPVAIAAVGLLAYSGALLALARTRVGPSDESRDEDGQSPIAPER